ncbi:hypothetical protein GCM10011332_05850 [Terasakiella brassicae]|uniref:Carrier domain-containing protein n=1 Tax=Terasakiella brassicae TaxID=1634917 RepID=A0A917BS00_9PROT|nr:non-ribosomal peptide synthetase [Terasakiella brassicae]GGF55285.1 hypothetical protein GCM10011332_05850 [Terasakiella brassicae]
MNTMIFDRKTLDEKQFWMDLLAEGPIFCAPKADSPVFAQNGSSPAHITFTLDQGLTQQIKKIAQGPFLCGTVLLSALMICLHKYNHLPTITIGTPTRKPATPTNDNMLAIRHQIDETESFRDFLLKLREKLLNCYAHQNYPQSKLVEDLSLETDRLFDVSFAYDEIHSSFTHPDQSALSLKVEEGENATLIATFFYDNTLYRPETVQLLARYYQHILTQALSDPMQSIDTLALDTQENIWAQTEVWNNTAHDFPDDINVMELLTNMAQTYPQNPALVYRKTSISYEEMMQQVDTIAAHLQENAVGPEQLVGVCLENPFQSILAFLGILRSGAAFLPLDPNYPDDRLSYMIKDSACTLVIGDNVISERMINPDLPILSMDALCSPMTKPAAPNTSTADNLAYVIYTSGSTGNPKGALLEHRGLCNFIHAQGRLFDMTPNSRVLQFASLSFDASISEIFVTLCHGAALHVATRADMSPVDPLLNLLQTQKITHLTVPPSLLGVLPQTDLPDLGCLIVAGESCPDDIAQKWSVGRTFLNGYGPTESTVCATFSHYAGTGKPLIGKPIENTKVHILDEHMRPVPVGVAGELYIESAGLARGYLNRDDLTQEKFLTNPFSPVFSNRIYRTGDLARWQTHGEVEFLGRMDHQIKLRGFRIELDEIAHVLCRHQQVENAIVISHDDDKAGLQILAFVLASSLETDDLRRFILNKLPEYMCPAHISILDDFPKLPNGKINRKALVDLQRAPSHLPERHMARDNIELALLQIWQEVLNNSDLGIHDDFFASGGHSLLAVRLLSRIERAFNQKLDLDLIFQHTSVADFAQRLRQNKDLKEKWSPLIPVRPAPNSQKNPIYCVHPAGGRVLCYLPFARELAQDIPVHGFQARGLSPHQSPFKDLKECTQTYVDALKQHQGEGPYQLLGWSGGAVIAYEMACILQKEGAEVSNLFLIDAYAPPALPNELKNMDNAALVKALLSDELRDTTSDQLRQFSENKLIDYLRDTLIKADIIPADYTYDDVARFFEVYKTNCALAHATLSPSFNGSIHLIRAEGEQSMQEKYCPDDPTLGWQSFATGDIKVHITPGNHNTMMEPPFVSALVSHLSDYLD